MHTRVPLPWYETLQESLEVGHTLLQEADGTKLIEGILDALYGECGMSIRIGICLTVLLQAIAISIILATFIVILALWKTSSPSLIPESGSGTISSIFGPRMERAFYLLIYHNDSADR